MTFPATVSSLTGRVSWPFSIQCPVSPSENSPETGLTVFNPESCSTWSPLSTRFSNASRDSEPGLSTRLETPTSGTLLYDRTALPVDWLWVRIAV